MQNSKKHKIKTKQDLDEPTFGIELTINREYPFYELLLSAMYEAFSGLGESAKTATYFHLKNTDGIKKREIPFRIDNSQNALEKLFGVDARHLEMLSLRKLHGKTKTTCEWDMPRLVAPEITFQEYLRKAKSKFENSNENSNNENSKSNMGWSSS